MSQLTNTTLRKERFFEFIEDIRYNRGGVAGLKRYADNKTSDTHTPLYSPDQAKTLLDAGIENRMKVKISDYYSDLATGRFGMPPSKAIQNLVTAKGEEVTDLSGDIDPSNQLRYSPIEGVLHKYEMALLYVSLTCSAHCRYCYRLDLFTGKSGKKLAKPTEVEKYIIEHNKAVANNAGVHPNTGRPKLREVLLSGGDPMILSNKKLAEWLALLAESGIEQIRIGTKDLAFYPYRFDDALFKLLDAFHETYPDIRVAFAVHFTHPDEFLKRDQDNQYIPTRNGGYQWMDVMGKVVYRLTQRRHYISLENQTPIIKGVNACPNALRILQRELYNHGIGNHYLFQCRHIEGHKHFALPVEEAWKIFSESQRGLSGMESHARFVMSAEQGKVEFVGVNGENDNQGIGIDGGVAMFRLLRSRGGAEQKNQIAIAKRNPKALWITDYEDRVLHDPAGIMKSS